MYPTAAAQGLAAVRLRFPEASSAFPQSQAVSTTTRIPRVLSAAGIFSWRRKELTSSASRI